MIFMPTIKNIFSPKFLLNFNNVENEVLQQEVILFVRMLLPVIVPLLMDIITQLVLPVILKYRPWFEYAKLCEFILFLFIYAFACIFI